jgi:hypothetical protein
MALVCGDAPVAARHLAGCAAVAPPRIADRR